PESADVRVQRRVREAGRFSRTKMAGSSRRNNFQPSFLSESAAKLGSVGWWRSCSFPLLCSKAIDVTIIRADHYLAFGNSRGAPYRLADFIRPEVFAGGERHHVEPSIIRANYHFVAADCW